MAPPEAEADGAAAALRSASSIFRTLSDECLRSVCEKLEEQRLPAGSQLGGRGGLCLLRSGAAAWRVADEVRNLAIGSVVGEAELLGCTGVTQTVHVDATTDCTAWVLRRGAFLAALAPHPADGKAFDFLERETLRPPSPERPDSSDPASPKAKLCEKLRRVLQAAEPFSGGSGAFAGSLAPHMEDQFLAAGEVLLQRGEPSGEDGYSYLVLGGRVHLEGEDQVLVHTAAAGEVVALALSLGIRKASVVSIRAWDESPVWLARLPNRALQNCLGWIPGERRKLMEWATQYSAELAEEAERRHRWLHQMAIPALAKTPLLEGCPEDFLSEVARHLDHVSFESGAVVATAGDFASSMLVLLEGCLDLESRSGARVGRLQPFGVIGEPEVLGLFDTRMVTARACTPGHVMEVPAKALRRALNLQSEEAMGEGFRCLLESRRAQVDRCLPLSALNIKLPPGDPSVRAIALQAERMHLEPGDIWECLPDMDPCGPRLAIFVSGRAVLELVADGREVMVMTPGSFLCEGDAAEFNAQIRVLTPGFEAYRVRSSDFLAAVHSSPKPADWFYHFRLKEKEVRSMIRKRLSNTRGLRDVTSQHPCDPDINDWKNRRTASLRRAEEIRKTKADLIGDTPPHLQLPLLPGPADFGTTASRSWKKGPRKMTDGKRLKLPTTCFPGLPKGLASYPVATQKLPRIASEPALRTQALPSHQEGGRRSGSRIGF